LDCGWVRSAFYITETAAFVKRINYFRQDERLRDESAVVRATDNATNWLLDRGYRNALVEINNECNVRYDHAILRPERVHEQSVPVNWGISSERKRGFFELLSKITGATSSQPHSP